jgi:hypothetical protein
VVEVVSAVGAPVVGVQVVLGRLGPRSADSLDTRCCSKRCIGIHVVVCTSQAWDRVLTLLAMALQLPGTVATLLARGGCFV